ncbi:hypothetical protein KW507_15825 [Vibrio fluvialis]|nr:hypothetical protein [Vibrio fluvialis]
MFFEGVKYRNPVAYYCFFGSLSICLLIVAAAGGYKFFQSESLFNLRMGVYYQVKATFLDGRSAEWVSPQSHFAAQIKGYAKGGYVVLKKPGRTIVQAQLADLIIHDEIAVAKYINAFINKTVYVDYYEYDADGERHNAIIVWEENGAPINLSLIDSGLAKPITKPPTNIVHKLFAQYYLGKLFK